MQELKLIDSFEDLIFPAMIGNNTLKKALSLQIFASPNLGEKLHIMGVGSIASGKTSIALELLKIMPNSTFTGKKVTPVGMIQKLISADGSILFADEIDKIDREAREMMLECMQSQQISYDKKDFHERIPTRTNVTAFCNPRGYVLNREIPIIMQVSFQLPLLSRFHFLLPVEEVDMGFYGDIARNLVMEKRESNEARQRQLMAYIIGVKERYPIVEMSESMGFKIGDWVRMVKTMSSMKNVINPRLIEGLISACKARARMNHRSMVKDEDWKYVRDIAEELYLSLKRR